MSNLDNLGPLFGLPLLICVGALLLSLALFAMAIELGRHERPTRTLQLTITIEEQTLGGTLTLRPTQRLRVRFAWLFFPHTPRTERPPRVLRAVFGPLTTWMSRVLVAYDG